MDILNLNIVETKVHIRSQQRNARKSLTTVEGIDEKYDLKRLLKAFRKEFSCNGTISDEVIILQGDQRQNVYDFITQVGLVDEKNVIIHGA